MAQPDTALEVFQNINIKGINIQHKTEKVSSTFIVRVKTHEYEKLNYWKYPAVCITKQEKNML